MDQEMKELISETIKEALKEGRNDCESDCGMTPMEHREAHKRMDEFFIALGDTTKTIRDVFIKLAVTFLVGATAVGVLFNAGNIWEKLKG